MRLAANEIVLLGKLGHSLLRRQPAIDSKKPPRNCTQGRKGLWKKSNNPTKTN
jgi:hypothetical protein